MPPRASSPRSLARGLVPSVLCLLVVLPPAVAAPTTARQPDSRPTAAMVADRAGISLGAARQVMDSEAAELLPDGTVVFVDDFGHDEKEHALHPAAGTPTPADRRAAAAGDLLRLHSDPTADQTIYLDFDGAQLVDTQWNTGNRQLPNGTYDGYSIDDDPALSRQERAIVLETWRATSSIFAAFDVDVTTEQPAPARIERSGPDDREFGSWVVVTTDHRVEVGTCGGCGGVAFLGGYGATDRTQLLRPSFAFGADAGVIAHEVGHQLGLLHDGLRHPDGRVDEYHRGNEAWWPIMGSGDHYRIAQWSRGEYAGATNTEDDYVVMQQQGLLWRRDEAGATTATAASAPGPAVLGRDDVDVVAVAACPGALTVVAEVPDGSPLDVDLELLDGAGAVVARSAGPIRHGTAPGDWSRLGQSEVVVDTSGRVRFARLAAGSAPEPGGYPTYGSIGGYVLSTGCDAGAPGVVRDLEVTTAYRQVTTQWTAPAAGLVTGYRVTYDGHARILPPGARSLTSSAPSDATSTTVVVEALTGDVPGPGTSTTVAVPARARVEQSAPVVDRDQGTAALAWSAVVDPGIKGATWAVHVEETGVEVSLPQAARSHQLGSIPADGTLTVEVCLRIPLRENRSELVCSTRGTTYAPLAPAPGDLAAATTDNRGGVEVTWAPVAEATGYQLSVDLGAWRAATSPARLDLSHGEHTVRVRALAASGPGAPAEVTVRAQRGPSRVRDLRAVPSEDGTRLEVTWARPADDTGLTGYQVHVPSQGVLAHLPAHATSWTLRDQAPGARVDVSVVATNAETTGELATVTVTMPQGPQGPGPGTGTPPGATVDDVRPGKRGGRTTLRVRWSELATDASHSEVSGWEIRSKGRRAGRTQRRLVAVAPDARVVQLRLPADRKWRVQVRARGVDGVVGPWSRASQAVRPR